MNEVARYFNRSASSFDAIYGGKGILGSWIDRRWRRGVYERFDLTFQTCGDVTEKTVLDVGCGSGRYAIEFAKRGASQVTGLDFAPSMLLLAQQRAAENNVSDRCTFIPKSFMDAEFDHGFDICTAIGFFDYVSAPRLFLEEMRSLAKELMIMSFPSRSPIRTPIRRARYFLKRCPVFFYDRKRIERLVQGLGESRIVKIPGQGQDYFVSIKVS